MLGLVCHIGDSSVAGNHLRTLPRRTLNQTQVIRTSPFTRFAPESSKHQVSRRTPYPFNAASESNRRERAHCSCGGGWLWVFMQAPVCLESSLETKIAFILGLFCHPGDSSVVETHFPSRVCSIFLPPLSSLSHVPIDFSVLSEYFGAATPAGG